MRNKIIENINGRISKFVWRKKLDNILPGGLKGGDVIIDINRFRLQDRQSNKLNKLKGGIQWHKKAKQKKVSTPESLF